MTTLPQPRVRTRASLISAQITDAPVQKSSWLSKIIYQPLKALTASSRQLKKQSEEHIASLATNIERFCCVAPIIVNGRGKILKGHAVLEACRRLGHETIPTVVVDHLDQNEESALRLSLSKFSQGRPWDAEVLAKEFAELFSAAPALTRYTGFKMPEIDGFLAAFAPLSIEPSETPPSTEVAVSRVGDLWLFEDGHKLLCGNARESKSYEVLLGEEKVRKVHSDPPYACPIKGHVSRSHGEFVEGSGLNRAEAADFFRGFMTPMIKHLADGAVVDLFIDWRGMHPLVEAAESVGLKQISHCVWDKGAGGMGSLYRHQVEHVLIFKWGHAPHVNNVQLGRHGRNRTTLWSAPGLAQFGPNRKEALATHPTVKPVGLAVDALLDTSEPGDLVLDPFSGSGTTLIAAHRARRICRAIELDPHFVDAALRRSMALGLKVRHVSGLTFEEVAEQRAKENVRAKLPSASSIV